MENFELMFNEFSQIGIVTVGTTQNEKIMLYVKLYSDWIKRYNSITEQMLAITYGSGKFVWTSTDNGFYDSNLPLIYTGLTVDSYEPILPLVNINNANYRFNLINVIYGTSGFLTVGGIFNETIHKTEAWKSIDGVTWTGTTLLSEVPSFYVANTTCYGNDKYIVPLISNSGWTGLRIMESDDLINWNEVYTLTGTTGSPEYQVYDSIYENGIYLLSGKNVWRSTDGINWSNVYSMTYGGSSVSSIAYGNGLWLISHENYIYSSTDSINWTENVLTNSLKNLDFFGDRFFGLLSDGITVNYTYDGITWITDETLDTVCSTNSVLTNNILWYRTLFKTNNPYFYKTLNTI